MARRRRSQVGQRISPWPVQPSRLQVNVTCPFCFRRSWLHRLFDLVPEGPDAYTTACDRWAPVPIELRVMRRWPRKPDGGRGFFWEAIPQSEFEQANQATVARVHRAFELRAIRWLDIMGVDVSSARLSIGLT